MVYGLSFATSQKKRPRSSTHSAFVTADLQRPLAGDGILYAHVLYASINLIAAGKRVNERAAKQMHCVVNARTLNYLNSKPKRRNILLQVSGAMSPAGYYVPQHNLRALQEPHRLKRTKADMRTFGDLLTLQLAPYKNSSSLGFRRHLFNCPRPFVGKKKMNVACIA